MTNIALTIEVITNASEGWVKMNRLPLVSCSKKPLTVLLPGAASRLISNEPTMAAEKKKLNASK